VPTCSGGSPPRGGDHQWQAIVAPSREHGVDENAEWPEQEIARLRASPQELIDVSADGMAGRGATRQRSGADGRRT
jgi:hypothetical protein